MRSLPLLSVLSITLALVSCESDPTSKFYTQSAPTKYHRRINGKVKIFDYGQLNIEDIYNACFNDCIRIGSANFDGSYRKPGIAIAQANKVGADCVLATSRHKGEVNRTVQMAMPTISNVSTFGNIGGAGYSGTSTIRSTSYVPINVTQQVYDQDYLFLKYTNGAIPVWEKTKGDFGDLSDKTYKYDLFNEDYDIEVHQLRNLKLAFIKTIRSKAARKYSKPGDLKFIEMVDRKAGLYMMGDRRPLPADMSINKFGHFEIKRLSTDEVISYARR